MRNVLLIKMMFIVSCFFILGARPDLVSAECTFEAPAFYVGDGVLEVPCLSYGGKCYHLTVTIDQSRGLYLKGVEASGTSSQWMEAGGAPFVATIDAGSRVLHIPQLRIGERGGLNLNIAYDLDLGFLVDDGKVLFDVKSLSQVPPKEVCTTYVATGSGADSTEEGSKGDGAGVGTQGVDTAPAQTPEYVVIAYNDLGMHCMNQDHSVLSILPPYNNIVAQVIRRGEEPEIVTSGVKVEYRMLENTTCSGTNFWDYVTDLFGQELEFCMGLKGNGLSGEMALRGERYVAEGVPVTPFDDSGNFNPYPIVEIVVKDASGGQTLATTQTVVPISYEMNCDKCHGGDGGQDTMMNILKLHDRQEGTSLQDATPVLCQDCHADPALGAGGVTGVPNFSLAIHGRHARLDQRPDCYDCHPGPKTQCQRTAIEGMQSCNGCHGDLVQMADSLKGGRTPWVQEPKCADCHSGKEMDTGTTLYRNAKGHHGVYCETCHYEPHAWWPSKLEKDNYQPQRLQGGDGPLGSKSCLVCHTSVPDEDEGPHGLSATGGYGGGNEGDDSDD